ncbi:membrane bound O-acyl transferase family-domain-containing protein [Aspergillus carlsbadensis]|nr:membrane bound O-acyl transferase family-domain-containing protein [Aspergillus carlsbadensis]
MFPSTQLLLTTYQASLPTILCITIQYVLGYVILGFIATFSPATSCLRPTAVTLLLALAISIQLAVSHASGLPVPIAQFGAVAISAWTQVFSALDILIHKRVTYEEHVVWVNRDQDKDEDKENNSSKEKVIRNGGSKQRIPTTPERSSICQAVYFALCLPNNTRLLGTKWQISPVYSFYDCSGPIPTPSRAKFLRMRACTLISSVLVGAVYLVYNRATCSNSSLSSYCSWVPFPFPSRATLTTVLNQIPSELLHPASLALPKSPGVQFYLFTLFLGSIFLLHKIGYTIYSLVAVGCNLCPPEHWPPFYGAPLEAWTMRRFWGNFWHQSFCSFLHSSTDFVVATLGLERNSLISRYTRYTICFFISGFLHLTLDHALGIRGSDLLGVMITFLLQPIAFGIEDLVGAILRKYSSSESGEKKDGDPPTRMQRFAGYIWVTAFTFWSWRFWGFAVLRRVVLLDD